jgi:hypothetical protein
MANTKHGADCVMAFGRKSPAGVCLRCDELTAGSAPRESWHKNHFAREAAKLDSIRAHFAPGSPHSRGACGPVCTFGDW